MLCPFLRTKWKELTGRKSDWSWLKQGTRIEREQMPDYWKRAMSNVGFTNKDITRCENRMVMGAMRYKSLTRTLTYPVEYYIGRIIDESVRALTNMEGVYDGVNICLLLWHSGEATENETRQRLISFHTLAKWNPPFNPEDRTEW